MSLAPIPGSGPTTVHNFVVFKVDDGLRNVYKFLCVLQSCAIIIKDNEKMSLFKDNDGFNLKGDLLKGYCENNILPNAREVLNYAKLSYKFGKFYIYKGVIFLIIGKSLIIVEVGFNFFQVPNIERFRSRQFQNSDGPRFWNLVTGTVPVTGITMWTRYFNY
uniref:Uncharacterized protein n=1 Tax=Meloidogyne hapla TaxID=6305 RepID=A0A1I8BSE0_MELHA